ncbi:hypothetical protein XELAEV_18037842mg [Xenopus laevis]|uniref:Uncharacterized protein n=1 Tax=Xenopus laevis TaxID=8355 RepID=A0A974CDH7_XENLA|nr:hypothetical protein XELAEV_18037842mg [Xenopus laevis]
MASKARWYQLTHSYQSCPAAASSPISVLCSCLDTPNCVFLLLLSGSLFCWELLRKAQHVFFHLSTRTLEGGALWLVNALGKLYLIR